MILLVLLVFLVACSPGNGQVPAGAGGTSNIDPQSTSDSTPPRAIGSELEDESQPSPVLPNHGPAPELTNKVWLNTDQPLRLVDLRGEVVLLEMWTFG
jgi:hypothetical protein